MGGFMSLSSNKFNESPPSTGIESTGLTTNKPKQKKNKPKLFTINTTNSGADKRGMYVNDF